MMKHEFEAIAGYEVSNEDYDNIIEPMYMATNLDKIEFVKCIDKKRFALKTEKELIKEMKKIAKHLYEICGHSLDYDAERKFDELNRELEKRFYNGLYCTIHKEYEIPEYKRGCTYPESIWILNSHGNHVKDIALVK